MRYSSIPVRNILPSQKHLRASHLVPLLDGRFNSGLFDPVPVVNIRGEYILGGGHHRSSIFYWAALSGEINSENIPVRIIESPTDRMLYFEGELKGEGDEDILGEVNYENIGMMPVFDETIGRFGALYVDDGFLIENLGREIGEKVLGKLPNLRKAISKSLYTA